MQSIGTKILSVPLIAGPLIAERWASSVNRRYDRLRRNYECDSLPCAADFDGDGISGYAIVEPEPKGATQVEVVG